MRRRTTTKMKDEDVEDDNDDVRQSCVFVRFVRELTGGTRVLVHVRTHLLPRPAVYRCTSTSVQPGHRASAVMFCAVWDKL